ncbi:MAG: DUF2142 domain-containing protein [Saprospiraceae bacterium]|nr:DUF2142 domain-containing protein [Saprospiraceae bacterium]
MINPGHSPTAEALVHLSPVHFFQITALSFGLAIIFLIPPFQVPDEADHFERAFHLAEGHFWGEQQDHRLGGVIPESIGQLEAIYLPMKFDYSAKQSRWKYAQAKSIELNSRVKTFADFPNTGLYPFTVYLPQIVAAKISLLLEIKPLYALYLIRCFALLFWVVLISKAIEIMPRHQWAFAFLALLPGSMFVNASASGDVVTNGVAFLAIAFFYRKIIEKEDKLTPKQLLWLALGIAILAWNKFVYAPVALLALLLPKKLFEKPAHRNRYALGLLLLALGIVAAWNSQTSHLFLPKDQYNPLFAGQVTLNEGVDPGAQFLFILENPGQFAKTLNLSFAENAQAISAHYFGKFGWEKNYLPGWTIGLLILATLFLFAQKQPAGLPNKARIVFVSIAALMAIGLATTLYLMWAPVGHPRILSMSGRYFIPVLPLIWLAMPGLFRPAYTRHVVMAVSTLALVIGLFAAFARYY